ncbi:MAG: hypothetical protein ACREO1_15380 [Arenimonas sp.]
MPAQSSTVLVAVMLHAWLDILWEFSGTGTYVVFAGSSLFWLWMLKNWPTRSDS